MCVNVYVLGVGVGGGVMGYNGLYLFSGVKIFHSCYCLCYQSTVSLDVYDHLIFALNFCSFFSCRVLKLPSGFPTT